MRNERVERLEPAEETVSPRKQWQRTARDLRLLSVSESRGEKSETNWGHNDIKGHERVKARNGVKYSKNENIIN